MADRFRGPARFVEKVGLSFLFGGSNAGELPNLHAEVTGRDSIEEWGPDTEVVWECRGELPRRGVAWFGEWLKGRGTFVAARLLPAALAWNGVPADDHEGLSAARRLSPNAALLYEALLTEGPLGSVSLRRAVGLERSEDRPEYQRALKALQRGLLITTYGRADEGAAWPSSVFELTVRAWPGEPAASREAGLIELVAAYRAVNANPDALQAARLFSAPVAAVRLGW